MASSLAPYELSNLFVSAPSNDTPLGSWGKPIGVLFEAQTGVIKKLSNDEINEKVIPLGERIKQAETLGYDPLRVKERKTNSTEIGVTGMSVSLIAYVMSSIFKPEWNDVVAPWSLGVGALSALISVSWHLGKLSAFRFNAQNLSVEKHQPGPCAASRELDIELYALTKDDPDLMLHHYEDTPKLWAMRYAAPAHTPEGSVA